MIDIKEDLDNLPQGWSWTKIGDICELINGRAFKAEDWSSNGLPIIRIQNLNNNDAEFNYCNFDVEDKYMVEHGQLLFAWSGTPGTSFGAHIWKRGKGVLNQHIFKININQNYINKKYLQYIINYNVTQYIKKAHGTAGLAHITKNKFESSFIPFPPLFEQNRIIDRIEVLFSCLDAGVQALQKAKAQLRRYRQSVLKAAVEGRLTQEWRATHKERLEPTNVFLKKIAEERRSLSIRKRQQLEPLPIEKLPDIPEQWSWTHASSVSR
jgi:type I restriction enzyme S subunit